MAWVRVVLPLAIGLSVACAPSSISPPAPVNDRAPANSEESSGWLRMREWFSVDRREASVRRPAGSESADKFTPEHVELLRRPTWSPPGGQPGPDEGSGEGSDEAATFDRCERALAALNGGARAVVLAGCEKLPPGAISAPGRRLGPLVLNGTTAPSANLSSARMRGGRFRGAVLSGSDFSFADLRQADFTEANLCGAKLVHADLRRADLSRATLNGADLRGADLCGAKLGDRVDAVDGATTRDPMRCPDGKVSSSCGQENLDPTNDCRRRWKQ